MDSTSLNGAAGGNCCSTMYPWNYQTLQRRRRQSSDHQASTSTSSMSASEQNRRINHPCGTPPTGQFNSAALASSSSYSSPKPDVVVVRRPRTAVPSSRNSVTSNSLLSPHHQLMAAASSSPRHAGDRRSCAEFRWLQASKSPSSSGPGCALLAAALRGGLMSSNSALRPFSLAGSTSSLSRLSSKVRVV